MQIVVISQIEERAKNLSSDDPKVREKAHESLVESGEVALWKIQRLKKSDDPEVKLRAISIEEAIRKQLLKRPFKTGSVVNDIRVNMSSNKKKYKLGDEIVLDFEFKYVGKDAKFSLNIPKYMTFIESYYKSEWNNPIGPRRAMLLFELVKSDMRAHICWGGRVCVDNEMEKLSSKPIQLVKRQVIVKPWTSKKDDDKKNPAKLEKKLGMDEEEQLPPLIFYYQSDLKGTFEITYYFAHKKYLSTGFIEKIEPSKTNKGKGSSESNVGKSSFGDYKIASWDEEIYSNTVTIEIE